MPDDDDFVDLVEYPDYPGIAKAYAEGVVAGRIESCLYVRQAAERYLRMLDKADSGTALYVFSVAWTVDVCDFIEKLPLSSGGAEGELFVLQPAQIWWLAAIFGFRRDDPAAPRERGHRLVREAYLEVPRGNGKALALDTQIPTPAGWTTMGELAVGDEVYAPDGTPTKVVAATDVMRDRPCYRVTFSNGETVIADAEHQWVTTARVDSPGQRIGRRMNGALTRVRTTAEIAATLRYGKRGETNHSVRLPEAIVGAEAALPIDPYVFGAWLGDGSSAFAALTASNDDAPFMIGQIEAAGYSTYDRPTNTARLITFQNHVKRGRGAVGGELARLGVRRNKHIPAVYLRASREQRLALLQGLMDTDGSCHHNGTAQEITSVNKGLAEDICELLASLGIRHSMRVKQARISGRWLDCAVYRIQFCVKRDRMPVFRMPRKLARMTTSFERKAWRNDTVQIVGCEPVASVPVRCIQVEHQSHEYLFGRTMLPTHNSELLAAVGLYLFTCEGEVGSKGFIGAPKEEQARYVFDPMSAMIRKSPDLASFFGLEATKQRIKKASDPGAYIRMVSSIAEREDGANPHFVIMEELHAQDESLFNVMDSSLGKRPNNLFLSITTAGNRAAGICWNTRKRLMAVLSGLADEISFFGVIYTLDADETKDEKIRYEPDRWVKANPMWGHTLTPSSMLERYNKARAQSPAAMIEFDRTRLNLWQNAAGGLVHPDNWKNCARPGLKIVDFDGRVAYIGGDLASKRDIAAIGALIPLDDGRVAAFNRYFIPAKAPAFQKEHIGPMYEGWVRQGWMTVTPTPVTDYGFIEAAIREWCALLDVEAIVFDNFQSNQVLTSLFNDGYPAMEMPTGTKTVSDPAKDFFALIEAGLLVHEANPVTEWMAMNVVGYEDKRGNILPQKDEPGSDNKIDGITALVSANVVRLDAQLDVPRKKQNIYNARGLAGFPT